MSHRSPIQSGKGVASAAASLLLLAIGVAGCSEAPATPSAEPSRPQEVGIIVVEQAARPYVRELPGRITSTRIAEVRARIAGIVIERTFQQGAEVKAGDVLYRLDPAQYQVELKAAEAALLRAEAVLTREELSMGRINKLMETQTASQAQFETAQANLYQARADVQARRADVERAKINLEHTMIRAPITGRIGGALVTEGALVGHQGDVTHLATIQQLQTVYVDFTQSVAEMSALRRALAKGDLENAGAQAATARLIMDNGDVYPFDGKLLFSDTTVDPTTGQVRLRGEFPNPAGELLPGMYLRVQIVQGIDPDSVAVPQQAIRRNDAGDSEVYVVRGDNRAVVQPVRLGRTVSNQWLVEDGLRTGDRVIVDGFQKFVAGDIVAPTAWSPTAQRPNGQRQDASVKGPDTIR
ncbi:MAG TPA: efflux RND transporter periplasmic adaptor subunit [Xanthobacteraceae bacterium]|nr:efflux RND transporter periplasmic adaptor subunit [Xanthobacteraceae bacterium]